MIFNNIKISQKLVPMVRVYPREVIDGDRAYFKASLSDGVDIDNRSPMRVGFHVHIM